jgi:hypothetical protein
MAYGILKCDNITFDNGGSDQNVTVSGLYRATTSGVTVTGTISGAVLVGTTTVSGATVTGNVVQGTTVQGVSGTFTSLTGTTTTGTTANFASGVFTTRVSGTIITGDTGQFTSGTFVSLTGTTITGTTINAVTVSSTTGTFTSLTGTTITGTTINGVTVAATTGSFTSLTGTTTSGTTANFVSGVFTTQVSGTTVTGTTSNFTSGNFATLSGATATFTSGVIALGTATNPSLSFVGDPNTGIYSPGANQLAVATNGTGRLFVDASGNVSIGTSSPQSILNLSSTGPVITLTRNNSADTGSGAINFASSDNTVRWQVGTNQAVGAGLEINRGAGTNNAVYIDTSNRVGIGTTSPGYSLDVRPTGLGLARVGSQDNQAGLYISSGNGSSPFINFLTSTSTLRAAIYAGASSDDLIFANGASATERARVDSSGRLLVGTSTARSNLSPAGSTARFQVEGANNDTNRIAIISNLSSAIAAAPAGIYLSRAGSSSLQTTTI